jgi:hypothetical protein
MTRLDETTGRAAEPDNGQGRRSEAPSLEDFEDPHDERRGLFSDASGNEYWCPRGLQQHRQQHGEPNGDQ